MTIPLLRLPLLASTKIIKYIDVKYLIFLIQLSTRAKTLVKLSEVHIELTVFQSSIQFQKLAGQGMVGRLEFSDSSEKPEDIPFKPPPQSIFDTKIQYQIRAFKKMMEDFVEFFKVCSVSFDLKSACSYTSLCFLEHAKGLGLKFTTAQVAIGGANPGVYRSLLDVCSNASQLLVLFDTEEAFTFNGFNEYRTHKLRFAVKNRCFNWFTVDHMCALINCSVVSVEELNWSNEDYNRFLKFWMASDGKLKSCTLWACRASIIPWFVLDGINHRQIRYSTYEIQRADGVKAEVVLSFSSCTLKVIDA
ncbi:hypothetical protein CAEBREN_03552 [Caenorhabditis brenneri]|uniref:F-box domain-containing protein n=1 Tax=Caenorhabditis brenneri TaxID=135651 RepID=G0MFG4_CAEBE|nr:hypothetical protein CAEBREN_03552 [Caenorhabditis brenneri]